MIFKFIFFIIFIGFFGLLILATFGIRIFSFLFRKGNRSDSDRTFHSPSNETTKNKRSEKIIEKSEGEYVDFEEVDE